ncbi:methyltransferase domain-containing protein [Tumebacillus sp. ITR2]|uniref:Methyltransferase n=1 Tax=Tumebacillus amylolyticus TaxID=2801339 RepID=A0ABS1JBX7_9BACL|nr:DNA methyltransferase [Tumebacillus amylolyticus]MBL0387710.1 methyltransferase domain-containing protein [Tumebacillus amylolyticus]
MATPAFHSQATVRNVRSFPQATQLDLLSTAWSTPQFEREEPGAFALSFSPALVRELIQSYSRPGDTVLDCFLGSGTAYAEALWMSRRSIGMDCNPEMVEDVRDRIGDVAGDLYCADARRLADVLGPESVDLVVTQPPYGHTHKFSKDLPSDLSLLSSRDFLSAIEVVAAELFTVLKPDGYCAILIGDIKDRGRTMPLGFQFVHRFLSRGFSVVNLYDARTPSSHLPVPLHAGEYLMIFQKKQKAPKRPLTTS